MRVVAVVLGLVLVLGLQAGGQQPSSPAGAALTERTDLAAAGDLAGAQRVLRFVQVSDAHILDDDAPYPLRQEPLDPFITAFSTSAQRPQDEYTDEVLESTVRAINDLHAQDPFHFVINTGDNIDNDLENELMRFIDLWDGTSTTTGPVSGLPCAPDGASTSVEDTQHDVTDQCTSLPEALLANRTALALGLPWYSAFGNHDTLIQGNVNIYPSFQEIAASSGRYLLTQQEYVGMHAEGDACRNARLDNDFAHGYGFAAERLCDEDLDNDGYYAFRRNGVLVVVLDTLNDDFVTGNALLNGAFNPQSIAGSDVIGGYAEGAIDPVQLAWLRDQIAANPRELVVLFSHHTINSMFTNLGDGPCAPGLGCLADLLQAAGYGTGGQLSQELAEQANVAAWFGGHTHRHRIQAKDGAAGGFWNVESSSLIDHPQQARVVELWVTADGQKGFWALRSFGHDFQPSKDLEATDPQRDVAAAGEAIDQDVRLWFDVPPGVLLRPEPVRPVWDVTRPSAGTYPGDGARLDFTARNTLGALQTAGPYARDAQAEVLVDGQRVAANVSQRGPDTLAVQASLTGLAEGNHSYVLLLHARQLERDVFQVIDTQAFNGTFATCSTTCPQERCTSNCGFGIPVGAAWPMLAVALAVLAARRRA